MNLFAAIVAGLIGTVIISMVMVMAPKMGLPKMAIWDLLGSMFNKDGNAILGWTLHLMMGIAFAIIYAWLWSIGIGAATVRGGLVFGAAHWLVVGLVMAGMPMLHAGIKAGTVTAPGAYMTGAGGVMGFMGGLVGHLLFGLVVALVYAAL